MANLKRNKISQKIGAQNEEVMPKAALSPSKWIATAQQEEGKAIYNQNLEAWREENKSGQKKKIHPSGFVPYEARLKAIVSFATDSKFKNLWETAGQRRCGA